MTRSLPITDFLHHAKSTCVVDVRTPAEFEQGHVPGAVNLPLFTNEERAAVGTLYAEQGALPAQLLGLQLVGPRLESLGRQLLDAAGGTGRPLLIHCWRGGMRSSSVAWLAGMLGLHPMTLTGGYKAFRRWVLGDSWLRQPVHVVAGMTGSGKTGILRALAAKNQPVLDLEALACHKGSVFGALGEKPQPTQEHFENSVAMAMHALPETGPVWLEDESRHIGKCVIPAPLWSAKQNGRFHVVDVPQESRVNHLIETYGSFPPQDLARCIQVLSRRLGGLRHTAAVEAVTSGDVRSACRLLLDYYDRAYHAALEAIPPGQQIHHSFPRVDPMAMAAALCQSPPSS